MPDIDAINPAPTQPRRIVLCFDGTGNKFQANESDTNIVKLYRMLDQTTNGQYHYYQPGIGTYQKGQVKSSSGLFSFFNSFRSNIRMTADQAVGASFVDHVTAGYQFVMRYLAEGDHIYIFGFSRGAYTARFLAEMIHNVGVLSKGNEEMIEFAWTTFSEYQAARNHVASQEKYHEAKRFMEEFRDTFCRPFVRIHFLGLFDCVNSVGQFEIPLFRNSYENMAYPAADYIRHAVSIHERRLKFKPALFDLDPASEHYDNHGQKVNVDYKEEWFAGNHGDVGGGWNYETKYGQSATKQPHLLSDTALNWMVQELTNMKGSESKLDFIPGRVEGLKQKEQEFWELTERDKKLCKDTSQPHDMLKFGRGATTVMTFMWWLIEIFPFFTRLEYINKKWVPKHWPPNFGSPRDIPEGAKFHESVDIMRANGMLNEEDIQEIGGDNSEWASLWKMLGMGKKKKQGQAPVVKKKVTNGTETSPLLGSNSSR